MRISKIALPIAFSAAVSSCGPKQALESFTEREARVIADAEAREVAHQKNLALNSGRRLVEEANTRLYRMIVDVVTDGLSPTAQLENGVWRWGTPEAPELTIMATMIDGQECGATRSTLFDKMHVYSNGAGLYTFTVDHSIWVDGIVCNKTLDTSQCRVELGTYTFTNDAGEEEFMVLPTENAKWLTNAADRFCAKVQERTH